MTETQNNPGINLVNSFLSQGMKVVIHDGLDESSIHSNIQTVQEVFDDCSMVNISALDEESDTVYGSFRLQKDVKTQKMEIVDWVMNAFSQNEFNKAYGIKPN